MDTTLGLLGGGNGLLDNSSPAEAAVAADLELGLGLSLGHGGAMKTTINKGSSSSPYGRILTAKDFPSGFHLGTSVAAINGGSVCGTKRGAADSVGPSSSSQLNIIRGPPSTSTAAAAAAVSQVIGWPPIKAYRINSLVNQAKSPNAEEDGGSGSDEKSKDISKKKINHGNSKNDNAIVEEKGHLGFVKVNMDGLQIGRKVDLNAHGCYETLAQALEEMFFGSSPTFRSIRQDQEKQPSKLLDGSSEFVLTYEDKEGDWMLVGDVPWGMFLSTAKRLRIMRKNSDANGLAPRFQEGNGRQRSKHI